MIAVLQYKHTSNPNSLPGDWPAETKNVGPEYQPSGGWVVMSQQELDVLTDSLRSQYESAIAAIPPPAPDEVLLYQFRAAVTLAGLKSAVDAVISSLPEPSQTLAREKWEYGNTVRRHHPMTISLGAAVGLTPAQIDDIFRTAASLQ